MNHKLQDLLRLSPTALHEGARQARARQARVRLAGCEWDLGQHLLAIRNRGVHRTYGCGSVVAYAVRHLELHPKKAYELVRTVEALQHLPHLAEAFRTGVLGWGKIREITRVATPENDAAWLEYARQATPEQVQRQVAVSPRELKRGKSLEQSLASGDGASEASAQGEQRVSAPLPEQGLLPGTPAAAAASHAAPAAQLPSPPLPPAPSTPRRVRVVFDLDADQYALYEKAEEQVRGRLGRRARREEVLAEMSRMALASADSRARARYQVVVHVDAATGEGHYETDRGALKASPEQVEEALATGRVAVVARSGGVAVSPGPAVTSDLEGSHAPLTSLGEEALVCAELQGVERSDPPDSPARGMSEEARRIGLGGPELRAVPESGAGALEPAHPGCDGLDLSGSGQLGRGGGVPPGCGPRPAGRRPAVPVDVVRAVYLRAGGRCEGCRARGPLHLDPAQPLSRGGRSDRPEDYVLRCQACHAMRHEPDFAGDPSWRAARDLAMAKRRNPSSAGAGRGAGRSP